MSIIRTKKSAQTPYVLLDTTALNDSRLSFRAKGLHAYLMSKPDGWQVHIEHLETVSSEGKHAIRMALLELARAGYLHREKVRGEHGHLGGWATTIYETPWKASGDGLSISCSPSEPTSDFQTSVPPTSDSPTSENRTLVCIDGSSKALNEDFPPTPINGGAKNFDPTSGEQSAETLGEHKVCSRNESAMSHTPETPPLRRGLRANNDSPRQRAAQQQEAARQKEKGTITACLLCDVRGQVELRREDDTVVMLRCPHDRTQLRTIMVAHGYHWPHAPPPHDGGPAP